MILEEAEKRLVERMSPAEKDVHVRGCQIVDFYMGIATNASMPASTRMDARNKLRAFACRDSSQTVADIDGKANT